MPKEPFDPNLFVGRGDPLDKIITWANETAPYGRLLSLVGSPGIGKSWLMCQIHQQLTLSSGRIIIWLNLSSLASCNIPSIDFLDEAERKKWLAEAIQSARLICEHTIRDFDSTLLFNTSLERFAQDLCEMCKPWPPPILMVDGFEEVSEKLRSEIENDLLVPFLAQPCTRVILTRRDDYALQNPDLRWNEQLIILGIFPPQDGREQLEKRLEAQHGLTLALKFPLLLESIPPYKWDHPSINTVLLDRIAKQYIAGHEPHLSRQDLRDCLDEIVWPFTLSKAARQLVCELAKLKDEWTEKDLSKLLGINLSDPELNELFGMGIVQEASPRYKLADGIRELIKAICGEDEIWPVDPT